MTIMVLPVNHGLPPPSSHLGRDRSGSNGLAPGKLSQWASAPWVSRIIPQKMWYPLVNIEKTMENHHFVAGKTKRVVNLRLEL